ncbi:alpha/beta fold hydrolase [Heyndrickxia oleronia]|uniref:alpha/beta fold hydrolase n=1 Tax=Heyndrickxia oleronia TaxID=38875 RepID=UPI00374FFADD
MNHWKREIIKTKRGNFEIFIAGQGNPICVTHHYSVFNESGDYFAQTFINNNKVILVNHRECGNSDRAEEPYQLSMIETVLDLEEIRQELGYSSWTYAGHSTGGMIGALYGIHYSSSLDSLIIVGSAARDYYSSTPECIYNERHPHFNRMQELMKELKRDGLSFSDRQKLIKERTQISLYKPERYEDYFNCSINKGTSAKRLNFFSREALIYDITRKLPEITSKTLILCGKHDVQCPVKYSIEMHQLIPDSQLHIFEQSNHYPFLEEKDEFEHIIHSFLK